MNEGEKSFQAFPAVEALLTVNEVSEILKVKVSTLRHWTAAGKIPVVRQGGLVRFRPSEIQKWIESNSVGGALL
jgi:excisionase family DNA binding protein